MCAGGLQPGQAQAASGLHLSRIHGGNAAADQLRHICAGVDAEGDNAHHQPVGGLQDQKVEDQQLHHHRNAPDHRGIHVAQPAQRPQQAAALAAVFDHGHQGTDGHADDQSAQRDDQRVFQPVHQQEITLLFDEGGLQLGQPAGKKLTDLLKNTHQLRGDTYTVSYSWKSFSTVPS